MIYLKSNETIRNPRFRDENKYAGFFENGELFISSPPFSESDLPKEPPLSHSEIHRQKEIWVEPISPDSVLRKELQGWYQVKGRFVENEYGNRFYMDTYGSKWLAFLSVTES